MMVFPAALCVIAVGGLLVAEKTGSTIGKWLAKPVAAGAYLWFALSLGAWRSVYGRWLLLALVLCFIGDVLLIPHDRKGWFRAGIVAFLCGHLVFIVAFLQLRVGTLGLGVGLLSAAALAWFVWRWLGSRLSPGYRKLVMVYVAVICAMLVVAFGAAAGSGRYTIAVGAALFALSDISVARDRFVDRGFINRLWGLPMYFAAQMILAATV